MLDFGSVNVNRVSSETNFLVRIQGGDKSSLVAVSATPEAFVVTKMLSPTWIGDCETLTVPLVFHAPTTPSFVTGALGVEVATETTIGTVVGIMRVPISAEAVYSM